MVSNKKSVMTGFDTWSEKYDENISQYQQKRRRKLLETCLKNTSNKSFLEVGIGTGAFSDILLSKFEKGVGVDISREMLIVTGSKLRIHEYRYLLQCDAENLPFPNNSFDCVVSIELVQYLTNPKKFFLEAHRILKQNGVIIIITWSGYYNLLQTMRRKLKFGVLDVSADKVNYSTPKFVKNELKRIGFKDIEHYGVSLFPIVPPLMWSIVEPIDNLFVNGYILKHFTTVFLVKAKRM